MSDLIPTIKFSDFKRLKASELSRLKSCEVISDGQHLFTFIQPTTDYVKVQAEYLALKSNTIGGVDIEDLLAEKAEA